MTIYDPSEELVSRCVECDLAEPESLASLGGSAPGLVEGILSLISDSPKNEISNKVQDILRAYNISDWQSEPHHQNQNPAEWRQRTIKAWTNTIMNRTGAPAYCWLLTLKYVCYILNHISTGSLGGQVPLQVLYGVTPDISIMLLYTFINPYSMLLMTNTFRLKVKKELGIGLVLLNIVVIHLPIKSLMLKP